MFEREQYNTTCTSLIPPFIASRQKVGRSWGRRFSVPAAATAHNSDIVLTFQFWGHARPFSFDNVLEIFFPTNSKSIRIESQDEGYQCPGRFWAKLVWPKWFLARVMILILIVLFIIFSYEVQHVIYSREKLQLFTFMTLDEGWNAILSSKLRCFQPKVSDIFSQNWEDFSDIIYPEREYMIKYSTHLNE